MNDANANDLKQQLSAMMDGELESQPTRFLLRRLNADASLQQDWARWHLARACLRGETTAALRTGFAAGIAEQIAADAVPARRHRGEVLRWAGGLAVAASVAMAALLVVPSGPTPVTIDGPVIAATPSVAPEARVATSGLTERDLRPSLAPVAQTVAAGTDARMLGPAIRLDPQLHGYVLRHNAALRAGGDLSYMPLLPVVAPSRPWSMLPAAANSAERR